MTLLLLLAGGCSFPSAEGPGAAEPADPVQEVGELHKQARQLEATVASLEDEKQMLNARLKELSAREEELTARVNRLQLINLEQEKQIEALRDAPAERDKYKARVDVLTVEVNALARRVTELRTTLRQMQSGVASPPPATQPATAPSPP